MIDNITHITGFNILGQKHSFNAPTFFLNGTLSIKYEDHIYLNEFPHAKVVGIDGAGHYIHMDRG